MVGSSLVWLRKGIVVDFKVFYNFRFFIVLFCFVVGECFYIVLCVDIVIRVFVGFMSLVFIYEIVLVLGLILGVFCYFNGLNVYVWLWFSFWILNFMIVGLIVYWFDDVDVNYDCDLRVILDLDSSGNLINMRLFEIGLFV